jgi:hypothetical protein
VFRTFRLPYPESSYRVRLAALPSKELSPAAVDVWLSDMANGDGAHHPADSPRYGMPPSQWLARSTCDLPGIGELDSF